MNFKRCPKCKTPNDAKASECAACGVQFADIRDAGPSDNIDRYCPYNDHGERCGRYGVHSNSTQGNGPWYCAEHWRALNGYHRPS